MCQLKHLTHHWKRSFLLVMFSGDANASSLPMANKCLVANLLLFVRGEGDEAILPSFASVNMAIHGPSTSLEALITTHDMGRGEGRVLWNSSILQMMNDYLLA